MQPAIMPIIRSLASDQSQDALETISDLIREIQRDLRRKNNCLNVIEKCEWVATSPHPQSRRSTPRMASRFVDSIQTSIAISSWNKPRSYSTSNGPLFGSIDVNRRGISRQISFNRSSPSSKANIKEVQHPLAKHVSFEWDNKSIILWATKCLNCYGHMASDCNTQNLIIFIEQGEAVEIQEEHEEKFSEIVEEPKEVYHFPANKRFHQEVSIMSKSSSMSVVPVYDDDIPDMKNSSSINHVDVFESFGSTIGNALSPTKDLLKILRSGEPAIKNYGDELSLENGEGTFGFEESLSSASSPL